MSRPPRGPRRPAPGAARTVFTLVFILTGASALTLQVTWQRVLSLHSGVDLVSFTTVVAAFLAGLGLGNLLGGWLADRLGPRRSVAAFSVSNLGIGVFAWVSIWVLYDLYRDQAAALGSASATFAWNTAFLLLPTVLMGLSLPLVAKAVVDRVEDAGPVVGRLYSVNTLGAAAGAAVSGWLLLGTVGFTTTVRVAGCLNVAAALLVLPLLRGGRPVRSSVPEPVGILDDLPVASGRSPSSPERDPAADRGVEAAAAAASVRAWPWYLLYATTGAVALGFEVVFFRLIDTIMRSNSYSFAHVLSLYLLLFGGGAALGARLVRHARRPATWFLWIEFAVGIGALVGVLLLVRALPALGFEDDLRSYFTGEGFNVGFGGLAGETEPGSVALVFGGAPLLVMALPVLLMGAAYPFVQALVSERADTLGRRTGRLAFSNIAGNVAGTLLVSFVVIDRAGTAGTYRLLALVLLGAGLAAAATASSWRTRVVRGGAALGVMGALLVAFPSNLELWEYLHGAQPGEVVLVEDRTCGTVLRNNGLGGYRLTINGSSQNDYPFDDFHVLIGLLPALLHDDPGAGMALGLGIGATPYGMALDPRVDAVHTVEICGGQVPLLASLAGGDGAIVPQGAPELQAFFADPRVTIETGDGRKYLLTAEPGIDIVTVDTLRPQSAFSGSLYSVEFYELVRDRLSDDGILAQWVPSNRSLNSLTEVFPYVVTAAVPSYNSQMMLASKQPITLDPSELAARFEAIEPDERFLPAQAASLREFVAGLTLGCVVAPDAPLGPVPDAALNRDLRPRDEYFVNNDLDAPGRPANCG